MNARDTAEHKQAWEEDQENEATIYGLVGQSLVAVFIADEAGKLVCFNPRFAQMTGYEVAADLIGKPLIDFISDDRTALSPDGKQYLPMRWTTPAHDYADVGPARVAGRSSSRGAPLLRSVRGPPTPRKLVRRG